jgi:LDH2 family malate/lactate/ureidoglycolate dehydrogenase
VIGEEPSKIRTREAAERAFIVRALCAVGLSESDAADVANVLVAADLRGVESHGIARLDLFYVQRIEAGVVNARPVYATRSTPETVSVTRRGSSRCVKPSTRRASTASPLPACVTPIITE